MTTHTHAIIRCVFCRMHYYYLLYHRHRYIHSQSSRIVTYTLTIKQIKFNWLTCCAIFKYLSFIKFVFIRFIFFIVVQCCTCCFFLLKKTKKKIQILQKKNMFVWQLLLLLFVTLTTIFNDAINLLRYYLYSAYNEL